MNNKLKKIDKNLNIVAVKSLCGAHHAHNTVPKIFGVAWVMHTRCNFDCSYCPPWLHDNFSRYISIDVVKSTVDTFSKKIYQICKEKIDWKLTGGEPLINPDIIEILKYIKNHKITETISVTSNGSVSIELLRKIIDYIDNFTLSLHIEKGFPYLKKTIEKFKILQEENIGKFFNITLLVPTGYLSEINEIANVLKNAKLKYSFRSIKPTFDEHLKLTMPGHKSNKIYKKGDIKSRSLKRQERQELRYMQDEKFRSSYYTDQEKKFFVNEERLEDFQNMGIWDTDDNYYELHSDLLHSNFMTKFHGWSCFAGIDHCIIQPNGDIHRSTCNNEAIIGNIHKEFNFKTSPMICKINTCHALPDIVCRKSKVGFEHKIT